MQPYGESRTLSRTLLQITVPLLGMVLPSKYLDGQIAFQGNSQVSTLASRRIEFHLE